MVPVSRHILLLGVLFFLLSVGMNFYLYFLLTDKNQVVRVVDGDSFDLKDGRRILLLGIDAPEKGRCMFEVGRERLEEIVLDKTVRLENTVIDDYGRILANVFVGTTLANKVMLMEGFARFLYVKSPYYVN
ncbi:hypothetical protein A2866_06525 [Candidatus Roizmanbacteria bacterium RIFCSPHIGHO2_01_FULL_39_8]|uniref:TNase-like domain-containing protein n=3 Tax=Candidatus Roizmaniibacteriota TaxID=1752723 RepID=A0A1F7GHI2_9BACT|nr:MAG: hypothetical protein A2866_06525 [Candidatus Roizmanbacteria bacterium RIFCSPHIGHO2_01_FULL_39_8]OGK26790.1 MAG: hypothetical protein A3C28_05345 [Candidatus Roizmanbacteria bacterium RIFCSPHIGHO2_02_FULL_39_9]OGK35949.1 MAG: hypothetical protein A3F60_01330 [Candidatus Roizmanbacteria bacterium RIFCSPHIGHO2_12_FULL_39_8]